MIPQKILQYIIYSACIIASTHAKNLRTEYDQQTILKSSSAPGAEAIGFVIGPILFFCSFVVIWANEKKALIDRQRLKTVRKNLSPQADKDIEMMDNFSPEIIYECGKPQILKEAEEEDFEFKIDNAFKIQREVSVLEYRDVGLEEPALLWMTNHQQQALNQKNSSSNWIIKSKVSYATAVNLGLYHLNQQQLQYIKCNRVYQPSPQLINKFLTRIDRTDIKPIISEEFVYLTSVDSNQKNLETHGTMRIKFSYSLVPETLSVISGISENTFTPYIFKEEDQMCCEGTAICFLCGLVARCMRPINTVNIIEEGEKTSEELIDSELKSQTRWRIFFRILSFLLIFAGIILLFQPITTMIGYIPIFGSYFEDVQGYIILGSLICAVPLYLLTTSLAWLFYRPKEGIICILLSIVIIIGLVIAGTA